MPLASPETEHVKKRAVLMGFKILQLGKYYSAKGGIETVTQSLVAALQNSRSTDVLCFSRSKTTQTSQVGNSTIWESGSLFSISTAPVSFSFFTRYKKIRNNYDIVLIHAPNPLAAIALWMFPTRAKVAIQWHSDILNKGTLYLMFRFFEKKMLERADLVLATTSVYVKHSQALQPFVEKTAVIPLGIDDNNLKSDDRLVEKIRQQYLGKKIVFSLGRFVYFKGFEYLIESAKYLGNDTVIIIGGAGPLLETYNKLIAAEKLGKKVFIIPENGNGHWGSFYEACDVFCLPSIEKAESFGLVLLEAMSFSKPIVATNMYGSGTPWVNEHGVTGYNVTPKNSKELAEAITRILNSSNYSTLCSNSRKRFDENFTHTRMISNMLSSFEAILH